MSNIPATEVPPLLSGFFTQNCLTASIVAFLIYDYVLTLGLELELFWCRRGAILSRLLFFVLRLSIIATAIMNVLSTFVTELEINIDLCVIVYYAWAASQLIATLATAGVTAVRAYAVTGGQCIWTTATSMLAFASFGCLARLYLGFSYQLINVNSSATCMFSPTLSPDHITILILATLICGTLADATLIAATCVRTVYIVKIQACERWRRHSITWLLFRDGTAYFLAVFSVNLVICIVGVRFGAIDWLANLAFPLQLVLLSRLLINLREASDRDVYMSSENTPNDNDEYPDTGIKQSTIRFNHTNTHSGAEEAFAPVDEQPSTIEEDDDADVHEELQDDLEWRAVDSVRAHATPAADGGPSPICA